MQSNKVIKNASWIIACRIAQAVFSLLVTMLTARYFGPSNYGLINYAASVVSFVTPIAMLGLGNIQVQELIYTPEKEGQIIGTSIGMSLMSGVLCIFGVGAFVMMTNDNDKATIVVCILYSFILLFQGAEVMQYWYQAKYISKYASITSFIAYALVSGYKIVLLITGKSIYWFAVSNAIDYFIIMCTLIFIYYRLGGQKLQFSWNIASKLFSKSKHYILANMMIAIFSQTDRIMIKHMIGATATGYYSAAVTCASLADFVFLAIIDSFRPSIFESYNVSKEKFENSISNLYTIIIYLSLLQGVVVMFFAGFIIKIIYGSSYAPAINTLRLVVWYATFSFMGNVRNVWILAEGQQRWLWIINLSGALANIIINYFLIPIWGIMGAAFASLFTQFFSNVIVSYLIPGTRPNTRLMLKGINPKAVFEMFHFLKSNIL